MHSRTNKGKDDGGYFDDARPEPQKSLFKSSAQSTAGLARGTPSVVSTLSKNVGRRIWAPIMLRPEARLLRTVGDGKIIAASYSRGNGRYVKVQTQQ